MVFCRSLFVLLAIVLSVLRFVDILIAPVVYSTLLTRLEIGDINSSCIEEKYILVNTKMKVLLMCQKMH